MSELLQTLTDAFTQSPTLALLAAFAWGICGMVLSPCHLAGIPLIIAYVNQQETKSIKYAAGLSTLFALGMLLMIALIGGITAIAGQKVGAMGSVSYYIVAAIFIVIGLDLVDVITLPWFRTQKEQVKTGGMIGSLLLGLIFGLACGPCTFAFLAPILAVTFYTATSNMLLGLGLLLMFGIGQSAVIILAGTSADQARRFANWSRETKTARRVRFVLGVLIILAGLYFVYRAI